MSDGYKTPLKSPFTVAYLPTATNDPISIIIPPGTYSSATEFDPCNIMAGYVDPNRDLNRAGKRRKKMKRKGAK
jgi:hypothetical protein